MQKRNENNNTKRVSFRVSSLNMNAKFDAFHTVKLEDQSTACLSNTSGRVFEHVERTCLLNNTSLDTANSIWVNSMRIRTESLDLASVSSKHGLQKLPLEVCLTLHCNNICSLQPTAYSVTIKIDPSCTKTFEFTAEAKVQIPISISRQTLISIKLQQPSNIIALKNIVVDNYNRTTTMISDTNVLVEPNNTRKIICSCLSSDTGNIKCQFPCYAYNRDGFNGIDVSHEDYNMQSLSIDLNQLDNTPVVLPLGKISLVSGAQAESQVAKLEHYRRQLVDVLYDCRHSTAMAELGATQTNAAETVKHIDWERSYCVPSDTHLSQVIVLARDMHHTLVTTSNMAVYGTWFFQPKLVNDNLSENVREAVCDLLSTRSKISAQIAGRRSDLQSVVKVRTSFLLLSAIDDALRSVCGAIQTSKKNLFVAENITCHAYWLGQIKSNTNNSVCMDDECYNEARSVLELCKRVKNSGTVLMPQCNSMLSKLTRSVWQNMHLQGLASADALVVANNPHFLYKQKQIVDYSKHPMLHSLLTYQLPSQEQLESTKLFAILVCADVEHRLITHATFEIIQKKWELACQKSPGALASLCSLFDPSVRSLITCACGVTSNPDISFITNANNRPPVTGYDDAVMSQYNSEQLMSQLSSLAL
jgi:hypothetical protein